VNVSLFEDAKYQYPKYDKARAMETRKSLEFNWINNIADGIEENIQGNTLILMTSYDNVYTMKEKLHNIATNKEAYIHDYKIIAASENESLEITKDKYIKAKESGSKVILIAGLNAYTGLDLPGDLIDTLVFAKLPFEPNIKFFSSYNYGSYSTHSNNKLKAILTFRQGLGRGLRSVSDKVCYLIFDNRILEKRNSQFLYFLDKMAVNADELAQ
jgi:ATP-dependent DNA helicase DinG